MEKDGNELIHFNALQLIIAALGTLLILSLMAYLTYQAVTGNGKPPNLLISTQYRPHMPHSTYKVEVRNTGEETASSVNIHFSLHRTDGTKMTSTMTINYVPAQSKEEGWAVFYIGHRPGDSVAVAAVAFLKP